MCQKNGNRVIPWAILGWGKLTGKYSKENPGNHPTTTSHLPQTFDDKDWRILEVLKTVAQKHECAIGNVTLAWALAKLDVPSVLMGCRTLEQLRENVKAMEVELDETDLMELDQASCFDLGFPHTFLGGTTSQVSSKLELTV
ncbi:Aldo/keto reductase [Gonapodya prolifera JEL478]|uniref:Aldo/keto reductase n=1 Tax=Gonapodya prolifera (strain JEL478) TaxID=1344416 RepID=A0A139AI07_GONPJ|nr:Aldo/keto reductase [Gonapodya prolifera JEL478]|eukprot:KXS16368.1 Aldo/keto reductase [Gonapodya prolifera JEL478]